MTLRIGKSVRRASVVAAALVAWQVGAVNASAQVRGVVDAVGGDARAGDDGDGHRRPWLLLRRGRQHHWLGLRRMPATQFAVGADVSILAMGNLDGNGQCGRRRILPPFQGTALNRYYIQVGHLAGAELLAARTGDGQRARERRPGWPRRRRDAWSAGPRGACWRERQRRRGWSARPGRCCGSGWPRRSGGCEWCGWCRWSGGACRAGRCCWRDMRHRRRRWCAGSCRCCGSCRPSGSCRAGGSCRRER